MRVVNGKMSLVGLVDLGEEHEAMDSICHKKGKCKRNNKFVINLPHQEEFKFVHTLNLKYIVTFHISF